MLIQDDGGSSHADGGKAPVDIFGDAPVEAEEVPAEKEGTKETDKEKEGGKKGDDEGEDEEEDDPRVSALEQANRVKDDNIRAMRKRIKELEKNGKDTSKDEVDLPYKDIKWSKDLPQDERDSMTEAEIRLMDQLAEMQERVNKDVKAAHAKTVEDSQKGDEEDDDDDWGEEKLDKSEAKSTARSEALKLAGGDKKIANEILEEYNNFNNDGLTKEQIAERIEKANKLRSDYEPPKEQQKKRGKPAKSSGASDPFGIDKIVEEVAGTGDKDTFAL